jgi:hypothetical protein
VSQAEYVAHKGGRGDACKVLVGKPEGKRLLGRLRHHGRIILKCILKKQDGSCGLDLSGSE